MITIIDLTVKTNLVYTGNLNESQLNLFNKAVQLVPRSGYLMGYGKDNKLIFEELFTYYSNEDLSEKQEGKEWKDYKDTHAPIKGMQGNIQAAKLNVDLIKDKIIAAINSGSIKRKYDPYNVIGLMMDKYKLSNKQTDKLMEYMSNKQLLY